MNSSDVLREKLKSKIDSYKDFPKKGIIFRDIFSLLRDPPSFQTLVNLLQEKIEQKCSDVDVIIGVDSRGFIFAAPLALKLQKPMVPIRKKGKLPGDTAQIEFSLEYGKDSIEIQKSGIKSGQKVAIIDDLLATGGTLNAAGMLVKSLGATVSLCLVCIELQDLKGRENVNFPVKSIIVL